MSSCAYGSLASAGQMYPTSFYTNTNEAAYNYPSYGYSDEYQLDRNSLMPANWQNTCGRALSSDPNADWKNNYAPSDGTQMSPEQQCAARKDDWYRYSPTQQSVQRYISSSGSSRFGMLSRNSSGRVVGEPNLLRTNPPVPLSQFSTFNDSSLRMGLEGQFCA